MQPRLSTSRKWTAFPKELLQQIRSVFKQSFAAQIGKGVIETDGRIYPAEILLSVGFKPEGSKLKQCNWEISIEYKRDKDNVVKLLNTAVDAAGSLFEHFFSSEDDHDFPRYWQELEFENRTLYIQYSTENTELEEAANKILGQSGHDDLAQGDWDEDESPESIKTRLGLDENDDDGGSSTPH